MDHKQRKRRKDWTGRDTVVATKVTDVELIALVRAAATTGRNRSDLIRSGIAHVTQQAALGQGGQQ